MSVSLTIRIEEGIFPVECVSRNSAWCIRVLKSYLVTRWHPSSLLDELLDVLVNLWSGLNDLIDGSLFPWSCTLNITQSLLQTSQFNLNLALCLLGIFESDLLEALDGLDLLVDIVGLWLESLVVLLDLINNLSVLQNSAVGREVDFLGLILELLDSSTSVVVSLLKVGKSCGSLTSKAELGSDFAPVELCGSALWKHHVSTNSFDFTHRMAPCEASQSNRNRFLDVLMPF